MKATPEQEAAIHLYDAYVAKLDKVAAERERGLLTPQDFAERILLITMDYLKGTVR